MGKKKEFWKLDVRIGIFEKLFENGILEKMNLEFWKFWKFIWEWYWKKKWNLGKLNFGKLFENWNLGNLNFENGILEIWIFKKWNFGKLFQYWNLRKLILKNWDIGKLNFKNGIVIVWDINTCFSDWAKSSEMDSYMFHWWQMRWWQTLCTILPHIPGESKELRSSLHSSGGEPEGYSWKLEGEELCQFLTHGIYY